MWRTERYRIFAAALLHPAARRARLGRMGETRMFRNVLGRQARRRMNFWFAGLSILATAFLAIGGLFAAARLSNAVEETGTSLALARLRAAQVSNLSYQIRFLIPRSPNEPIRGSEQISFDLIGPLRPVILDFQGDNPQSFSVNSREVNVAVVRGHIEIPAVALRAGHNSIQVSFVAGELGFHRRDDFLYTLFVPDNASKSFPCFDQPDLKARFELTLQIPSDWEAVSQGRLVSESQDGDKKRLQFALTQPTSTYLFAFAAGKFATAVRTIDGRRMTMFHRESDLAKVSRNIDAIFELHRNALSWMELYTGIHYPYEKFDFVILPAFPFSGMEHPGSIFYSDKSLFLDDSATQSDFLARARTISHETAHIWFGDLVTMRWFDDVWLKEVFANFMADKIVGPQFPSINHPLSFFLAHYPSAYSTDRTKGSSPIRQNLDNLDQAGELYGDIIYHKAPIAMRQLEAIVGAEKFQQKLRVYLQSFEFANATWPDLIRILGDAESDSLLASWDKAWIQTSGRPTIRTAIKDDRIVIASADPEGNNRAWPQTLLIKAGSSEQSVQASLLIGRDGVVSYPLPPGFKPSYVLTDAKEPGYGLILLDDRTVEFVINHLEDIRDENLRAVAWVNLWENMVERRVAPKDFVNVAIRALPLETQELTIDHVLRNLRWAYWALLSDSERQEVHAELEEMLWRGANTEMATPSQRASYFKAYLALFSSEQAWENIYRIWSGETKISRLALSESDFMDIAYNLSLRRPHEGRVIADEQLQRIDDGERRREFEFVSPAAFGSELERDQFFGQLLQRDGRRNEPWVRSALYYLHHPIHGTGSEKYVAPSLQLLTEVKATGGIFFPSYWLAGSLQFHVTRNVRATVDEYLGTHASLQPGLKLKLLQAADILMRFTDEFKGR
jgi:aminopeptidase N